jgi:hypothetical protein
MDWHGMYYRDHAPPHFHARYGSYAITVELDTWIVEGRFPPRSLAHIVEWARLHAAERRENWLLAEAHRPLRQVAPLD